jgi:carboxymethylenebutenolidase
MDAFLAEPDGDAPHPGVLVIHEAYGLNEHMRDVARRFAAAGYVALAVDLFSNVNRPLCLVRVMSGILFRPLRNGTLPEVQGALRALQARATVDRQRTGAIGFCMGGSYALQLACVDGSLKAASVFYGQNPRPLEAVARACPIVGSYPQRDFTAGPGRTLAAALQRHGVPHDVKIYPKTLHSFFNDQGRAYDAEAAADAWSRTLQFFETHLSAARART